MNHVPAPLPRIPMEMPIAARRLARSEPRRAINAMPTRDMSVWEGVRALRGAPGSKVSITWGRLSSSTVN